VTSETETVTDSDTGPSLRELTLAAARTSDAAAALLCSLTGMGRAARAARLDGHTIGGVTRELRRGRTDARYRRARALIRPSVRLAAHSAEVIAAAAASGLADVRVFGSCVRGEASIASDVDLLVTISERTSLLDLTRFAIAVEDLLTLDEGRADVVTGDVLRTGSDSSARIAAECQPLAAWAARWPALDSVPGWLAACAAGASEEELMEAAECGLHPWGETATQLRYRPEGRPVGATLTDLGEVDQVAAVLTAYAAARAAGLGHDAAITRAVTSHRPA